MLTELQEHADKVSDAVLLQCTSFDFAVGVAKQMMGDETPQIIDGVAERIYRRAKALQTGKVRIKTNEDVNAVLEIFYRAFLESEAESGAPEDYTGTATLIHAAISASDGDYLELTRDQVRQIHTDLVECDLRAFLGRIKGARQHPEFRQID